MYPNEPSELAISKEERAAAKRVIDDCVRAERKGERLEGIKDRLVSYTKSGLPLVMIMASCGMNADPVVRRLRLDDLKEVLDAPVRRGIPPSSPNHEFGGCNLLHLYADGCENVRKFIDGIIEAGFSMKKKLTDAERENRHLWLSSDWGRNVIGPGSMRSSDGGYFPFEAGLARDLIRGLTLFSASAEYAQGMKETSKRALARAVYDPDVELDLLKTVLGHPEFESAQPEVREAILKAAAKGMAQILDWDTMYKAFGSLLEELENRKEHSLRRAMIGWGSERKILVKSGHPIVDPIRNAIMSGNIEALAELIPQVSPLRPLPEIVLGQLPDPVLCYRDFVNKGMPLREAAQRMSDIMLTLLKMGDVAPESYDNVVSKVTDWARQLQCHACEQAHMPLAKIARQFGADPFLERSPEEDTPLWRMAARRGSKDMAQWLLGLASETHVPMVSELVNELRRNENIEDDDFRNLESESVDFPSR